MQQAICQFMQEGYFEKNLNRMRAIYKSKHDYMLAELKKYSWVREIMGENSGLHLLVEVDTDCSEQDVIEACAEQLRYRMSFFLFLMHIHIFYDRRCGTQQQ